MPASLPERRCILRRPADSAPIHFPKAVVKIALEEFPSTDRRLLRARVPAPPISFGRSFIFGLQSFHDCRSCRHPLLATQYKYSCAAARDRTIALSSIIPNPGLSGDRSEPSIGVLRAIRELGSKDALFADSNLLFQMTNRWHFSPPAGGANHVRAGFRRRAKPFPPAQTDSSNVSGRCSCD